MGAPMLQYSTSSNIFGIVDTTIENITILLCVQECSEYSLHSRIIKSTLPLQGRINFIILEDREQNRFISRRTRILISGAFGRVENSLHYKIDYSLHFGVEVLSLCQRYWNIVIVVSKRQNILYIERQNVFSAVDILEYCLYYQVVNSLYYKVENSCAIRTISGRTISHVDVLQYSFYYKLHYK